MKDLQQTQLEPGAGSIRDCAEAELQRELLPLVDADCFNSLVFGQTGVFVIRKAIPDNLVACWRTAWEAFYNTELGGKRFINKFNPVAVDEVPPDPLNSIYRENAILDIVEKALGPDIALYNQRFVIKDRDSRDAVFLHHDSPYHRGFLNKLSAFVALSDATPENGGLYFLPGTHRLGYLGDAGELNREVLPVNWPELSPSLSPGDIVLMHSSTWHGSGPHRSGSDRVLVDVIYQCADDPSGKELLRGRWRTNVFLRNPDAYFKRSRVSRIKELQQSIESINQRLPDSQK